MTTTTKSLWRMRALSTHKARRFESNDDRTLTGQSSDDRAGDMTSVRNALKELGGLLKSRQDRLRQMISELRVEISTLVR